MWKEESGWIRRGSVCGTEGESLSRLLILHGISSLLSATSSPISGIMKALVRNYFRPHLIITLL